MKKLKNNVKKIFFIFIFGLIIRLIFNNYEWVGLFIPLIVTYVDDFSMFLSKDLDNCIMDKSLNEDLFKRKFNNPVRESVAHTIRSQNVDNNILDRCKRKIY